MNQKTKRIKRPPALPSPAQALLLRKQAERKVATDNAWDQLVHRTEELKKTRNRKEPK